MLFESGIIVLTMSMLPLAMLKRNTLVRPLPLCGVAAKSPAESKAAHLPLALMEGCWAESGDWRQRRVAYMRAMERLYNQFPKDDEVTAFYALSLLSGGGLYDNLDWSFSVAHPDGAETRWDKKLGGGSPALRRQLGILRAFLEGFDLPKLKPDRGVVKGGVPGTFSVLAERGKQYAIYLDGGNRAELRVDLPAGDYAAEWIDTRSGAKARAEDVAGGGVRTLESPGYAQDIALRIVRKGPPLVGGFGWSTDANCPAAAWSPFGPEAGGFSMSSR